MPVYVRNAQRKHRLKSGELKKQAQTILESLGCSDKELSVLLVGDEKIRELNVQYRNIDRPTDVLSFPQNDEEEPVSLLLGDIVISVETAWCQARDHNLSFDEELTLLLIHGTLHLLGYDHEKSASAARSMRRKTRELFQMIFPKGNMADTHFF